jgi:hypothetical protein
VTSVAKETKVQIMNIIIHTGIFSNIDNWAPNHSDSLDSCQCKQKASLLDCSEFGNFVITLIRIMTMTNGTYPLSSVTLIFREKLQHVSVWIHIVVT